MARSTVRPMAAASHVSRTIKVNRAPVLTLWAAVVAGRLGFTRDEALALGRAVAGLNVYSKGVALRVSNMKALRRRSPRPWAPSP